MLSKHLCGKEWQACVVKVCVCMHVCVACWVVHGVEENNSLATPHKALRRKQLDYNSLSHLVPSCCYRSPHGQCVCALVLFAVHTAQSTDLDAAVCVWCCPSVLQVIGTIDGSGRVRLVDKQAEPGTPTPVDLNLDQVGKKAWHSRLWAREQGGQQGTAF